MFEAVIYIHRPCPTRTGSAVVCFYVEIEGLSSRELFLISVVTISTWKRKFRRVNQQEQIFLEKHFFPVFPIVAVRPQLQTVSFFD